MNPVTKRVIKERQIQKFTWTRNTIRTICWSIEMLSESLKDPMSQIEKSMASPALICTGIDSIINPTIFNIIRWVAGSMGWSSYWPSVWCCKYPFNFFYKFTKKRVLSALSASQQPTVLFSIYQNNTWTIRGLVDETINQVTQRIILKIVRFIAIKPHSLIFLQSNTFHSLRVS